MQPLSIWSSRGGLWLVPQLESGLGSSCCFNTKTRSRKKCSLLLVSSNSRKLDLGNGVFPGYSELKVVLFHEPKKGPFGSSVALAWALEQQAAGSEFESSSLNGLSGKIENGDVVDSNYVGGQDSGGFDDHEEKNVGVDFECVKEEEEKVAKVDTRELVRSLQSAKTADDVENILKDKGELPPQVYSSVIRFLGRDKRMASAFALVEWLNRKKEETGGVIGPNHYIYNCLLGAVKNSEQFGVAEKVINDMAHQGFDANLVTYNTLMVIYVKQGKATQALDILGEIQKKGFPPCPISYSTALLAYRRMEDGNGALNFFVELRNKYLNGDFGKYDNEDWEHEFDKLENFTVRICYQVMRQWLVKSDNLSTDVLKLLIDMDKAGLKPGRADLERLLWACTREEHYVVAKELYERIRERHSVISLSVCNHVMWLMGKAKKWWAALEIYEDLLDKGPKPNNMSYQLIVSHFNILLTAARKRGIWRWGVRLLDKMEEKGLKPGSREWNAVLIACSKASETSAAIQIFKRMVEQGEKPTIITYGALLSTLEKGKLYDEAFRVWEHMLNIGLQPNLYVYTIMASIFSGQGKLEMVDQIVQEMVSSGIEPTVVTYNAIVTGCAKKGMSSAAYEWFHRMKVQNITPNEITYEMLIGVLAKDGKPRLASDLYLRAQNEGLILSTKAYDAVIESSQLSGATIDESILGPRPPDKKKILQHTKTLTTEFDRSIL